MIRNMLAKLFLIERQMDVRAKTGSRLYVGRHLRAGFNNNNNIYFWTIADDF